MVTVNNSTIVLVYDIGKPIGNIWLRFWGVTIGTNTILINKGLDMGLILDRNRWDMGKKWIKYEQDKYKILVGNELSMGKIWIKL